MKSNNEWFDNHYENYWLLEKNGIKQYPRDSQINILKKIDEALESGYKNIIVNAGVGIGKSAISSTILNSFASGYICTQNINLQNQYLNDFHNLTELKGKPNYPCNYEDTCDHCYITYLNDYGSFDQKLSVLNDGHGRSFYRLENCSDESWYEIIRDLKLWTCNDCSYKIAIRNAQLNPYVIANYYSLYFNSAIIKRFEPRDIILFDECHNLELISMNMVKFTFKPNTFYNDFNINVFDTEVSELKSNEYWEFIFGIKHDSLTQQRMEYQSLLDNADDYFNNPINSIAISNIINDIDIELATLEYHIGLLAEGMFIKLPSPNNRKLNISSKYNKITFEPVFGEQYVSKFLEMGDTRIFLTGTLPAPKKWSEWIGLDYSDVKYIYEKSPYPVENRPVVYSPIANFNGVKDKYGEYTWMKFENILKIKKILFKHTGEKIIIHTTSNDQTNWLYNNLIRDFDCVIASGKSRNEIIDEFKHTDNYSVLISPSIKEGVDFKGDCCTVQIILKLPRPGYYGAVKERVSKYNDSDFMDFFTAINLMQAYGRGVRSPTDNCVTYILDNEFRKWYRKSGKLFLNEYFLEALEGL